MDSKSHWETVYRSKGAESVSWYRPHLDRSLAFLEAAGIGPDAAIIDGGGGASTLVDDLLDRGYRNVTVLDLSEAALETARQRLGPRAGLVRWLSADVTSAELPDRSFDFWHDRAVFHFLRDPLERDRYVETARRALKPGGHIVVATFGPDGPQKCSGLEVMRYSAEQLHGEFGEGFARIADTTEVHTTPWGSEQEFVYCYCRVPR